MNEKMIPFNYKKILENIQQKGLNRHELIRNVPSNPSHIIIDGKELINLSSNDYLGLSNHPSIINALCDSAKNWGAGAGASRMVCGTTSLHRNLEKKLSEFTETESCLLFNSGYMANVGIISTLSRENDIIFSDKLNHASIVDGCRLSKAKVKIFNHLDINHLESLLQEEKNSPGGKIIITETTFSTDGDEAPLEEINAIAERYGAILIIDEAHSFGIKGKSGAGLASNLKQKSENLVIMGTLGKSAGVHGAFVCSKEWVRDFLINTSRTFIYTTAPPPAVAGAVTKAIEIIEGKEGERLRQKLRENCKKIKEILNRCGFICKTDGPIFSIRIGDPFKAVKIERDLREEGILIRAMRYPTVPEGSEMLRIVVNAALSDEDIEKVHNAFKLVKV